MMSKTTPASSTAGPVSPLAPSEPAPNTVDAPVAATSTGKAYRLQDSGAQAETPSETTLPGPPTQLHSPFHPQRDAPVEVLAPAGEAPPQRLPVQEERPFQEHPAVPPAKAEKLTKAERKKREKEQTVRMIDERAVKHKQRKLILWIWWLAIMLLSIAYCVMAWVSYGHLRNVQNHHNATLGGQLWGPLTALLFTPILVFIFFILGTVLLLVTTVRETGVTYGYGFLSASALWLAFMVVFSSVVLNSYNAVAHNEWVDSDAWNWSSGYASLMRGTYILGYILTGLYLVLFAILILFKNVTKQVDLQGAPAMREVKVTTE